MRHMFCLYILSLLLSAGSASAVDVDIPYTRFVLDNGLTLIVHTDDKAPIVAVNVWYHVGSKNERPGKTGFAHLFEHLMFNGSENADLDYFGPMERVGATGLNGTTSEDRTNYFQNVPSTALDLALFMESDRMGHLLGAITQEKLDEQRGVVQNEKRQRVDNAPYGRWWETMVASVFPKSHPYSWSVIGSMEDLDAATLEDVHEWFKTYYGAANAVVVVAGDVDVDAVHEKVVEHFGDIPAGPPVTRQQVWIPRRTGVQRQIMHDRVPQARIYMVWNIPEHSSPELDDMDLVSDLLGLGKTSRFYRRLVYEDQIATDVSVTIDPLEIGGLFIAQATAQPGGDLAAVEAALWEELELLLTKGPTKKEVERIRTQHLARFIRGSERIGGFGGKSDILASSEVFGGRPDYYKTRLQRIEEATPASLQRTARKWLADGAYVLQIHPFPEYTVAQTGVDRRALPEITEFPSTSFPTRQMARLDNGLKVILVERHTIPTVDFQLLVDAGYASDQLTAPGTARLALDMLDEGTKRRSSLQINEQLNLLGAELTSGSILDMSTIRLNALREHLDASLEIFTDVLLHPAFPAEEFERLRNQQLAGIQREKSTPFEMALRVFPQLLYGTDHPYGLPWRGTGTETSVAGLRRQDLQDFHRRWIRPDNATLVIVGDITLEQATSKLNRLLASWEAPAEEIPAKPARRVEHQPETQVYLMDRPGSAQSIVFAAHVAPPTSDEANIAIEALNDILGGSFSARINMNLREDKHWSYGARSVLLDARGQRPFLTYASVQSDKTAESMAEIAAELRGILTDRPATPDELRRVKDYTTLALPGRWETSAAVAGSIAEMVRFGLPDNYWDQYSDQVRALDLEQISTAASQVLRPDQLIWLVVGDRAQIEVPIRDLGYGELRWIDTEGQQIVPSE